jgi:hypothetical protein
MTQSVIMAWADCDYPLTGVERPFFMTRQNQTVPYTIGGKTLIDLGQPHAYPWQDGKQRVNNRRDRAWSSRGETRSVRRLWNAAVVDLAA